MALQEVICTLFQLGRACPNFPMDKLLIEYLLVPSVVTIIMLYMLTNGFMRGTGGIAIHSLVAIMLYIVFVYSGLYGIFAVMSYSYVILFLIFGAAYFFLERFISPDKQKLLTTLAASRGEMRHNKETLENEVKIKEKEIERLEADLEKIRKDPSKIKGEGYWQSVTLLQNAINDLKTEKQRIELMLSDMKRQSPLDRIQQAQQKASR